MLFTQLYVVLDNKFLCLDNSFSNVSSTEELHEGIKRLVKALSDVFPVGDLSLWVAEAYMHE